MLHNEWAFPREDYDDQAIVAQLGLTQPIEGITFKAPQLLAVEYGKREPKCILSLDKGMGKTLVYLYLTISSSAERIIILCSKNAMATQRKEILKWFPQYSNQYVIIDQSQKAARQKLWQSDARIFIASSATFLADMGLHSKTSGRIIPSWAERAAFACDEFHRFLRTRKSKLFDLFKSLSKTIPMLILSSGSAGGKGPQDCWAGLHLTNGKKFSAYWKYVYNFCEVQEGHFGKTIGQVKNVPAWRQHVSSNLMHRRKDLKDYPPKTRQALDVIMEPWQKALHDKLLKEFWAEMPDGDIVLSPNVMAAMGKVRQMMICPKILSPSLGYGAGIEAILEDVKESELTHFVISTRFIAPMEFIEYAFREAGYNVWRLSGSEGIDANEQDRRIAEWTKKGGLIIQSIMYAQSYELPAARIMYVLGADYDPENNAQAEDRIHRDIRVTPHPVDIYYVRHLASFEEELMGRLSDNADNIYNAMNRPLSEVFALTRP